MEVIIICFLLLCLYFLFSFLIGLILSIQFSFSGKTRNVSNRYPTTRSKKGFRWSNPKSKKQKKKKGLETPSFTRTRFDVMFCGAFSISIIVLVIILLFLASSTTAEIDKSTDTEATKHKAVPNFDEVQLRMDWKLEEEFIHQIRELKKLVGQNIKSETNFENENHNPLMNMKMKMKTQTGPKIKSEAGVTNNMRLNRSIIRNCKNHLVHDVVALALLILALIYLFSIVS